MTFPARFHYKNAVFLQYKDYRQRYIVKMWIPKPEEMILILKWAPVGPTYLATDDSGLKPGRVVRVPRASGAKQKGAIRSQALNATDPPAPRHPSVHSHPWEPNKYETNPTHLLLERSRL